MGHRDSEVRKKARELGLEVDQALRTGGISDNAPLTIQTNVTGLAGSDCRLRELVFIILRKVRRGMEKVYSSEEARKLSWTFGYGAMHITDVGPHYEQLLRS